MSAGQANYLRSLPLHSTQKEIERSGEFSIFQLHLCPEFDFKQEVLSMGEDIEVLEPVWLRKEIAGKIKRMWNKYNTNFVNSENMNRHINYNELLDALFEQWEDSYEQAEKDRFCRDGLLLKANPSLNINDPHVSSCPCAPGRASSASGHTRPECPPSPVRPTRTRPASQSPSPAAPAFAPCS